MIAAKPGGRMLLTAGAAPVPYGQTRLAVPPREAARSAASPQKDAGLRALRAATGGGGYQVSDG